MRYRLAHGIFYDTLSEILRMTPGNDGMANQGHVTEAERLATFGARLNNVETAVSALAGKMDAFISSFNERSRTPWGLIISMVSTGMLVVATVGGLAYAPVIANLNRLELNVKDVSDSSLSVSAFTDFRNSYESNRQITRNEYIDRFNNIKADHDKDVAMLGKRMDELVQQIGGTYGMKDFVARSERERDDMQRRINELEARTARIASGVQ